MSRTNGFFEGLRSQRLHAQTASFFEGLRSPQSSAAGPTGRTPRKMHPHFPALLNSTVYAGLILLFGSFQNRTQNPPLSANGLKNANKRFSYRPPQILRPRPGFCRIGALVFREPLKIGNLAEKMVFNGKITPCARLNNGCLQTLAKPDFSSLNPRFSSQANF